MAALQAGAQVHLHPSRRQSNRGALQDPSGRWRAGREATRTPGRVRGGEGWELAIGLLSSLLSVDHPVPKEKGNPLSIQDLGVRKTEDEGERTHHRG